jgi:hypothetical protein
VRIFDDFFKARLYIHAHEQSEKDEQKNKNKMGEMSEDAAVVTIAYKQQIKKAAKIEVDGAFRTKE